MKPPCNSNIFLIENNVDYPTIGCYKEMSGIDKNLPHRKEFDFWFKFFYFDENNGEHCLKAEGSLISTRKQNISYENLFL